jgi:hypothetical protein
MLQWVLMLAWSVGMLGLFGFVMARPSFVSRALKRKRDEWYPGLTRPDRGYSPPMLAVVAAAGAALCIVICIVSILRIVGSVS